MAMGSSRPNRDILGAIAKGLQREGGIWIQTEAGHTIHIIYTFQLKKAAASLSRMELEKP